METDVKMISKDEFSDSNDYYLIKGEFRNYCTVHREGTEDEYIKIKAIKCES